MCKEIPLIVSSIYSISIVSDASFPLETCPKGITTAEEPPPIAIASSISPPFTSNFWMHVLLHPIISFYNWPSSPHWPHNFTLYKLFTILLNMTKHPQIILLTHSTTAHFTPFAQGFIPNFSYTLSLLLCHFDTCTNFVPALARNVACQFNVNCCEVCVNCAGLRATAQNFFWNVQNFFHA